MHEIFIKIFIRHFSPRLFFSNVAIETNDGFIVLDINFSAIFFNYRNQNQKFLKTEIKNLLSRNKI